MMTDRQRFEGAQWFLDIHGADRPSPELLQRWLRWLDDSEGNAKAYQAAEVAWHEARNIDFAKFEAERDAFERDYDPSISVAEWLKAPTRLEPRRAVWALAASVLIAVALGGYSLLRQGSGSISKGQIATQTAEHKEIRLADGSQVTLGARSRLSVEIGDRVRDLRLDSGEAFFAVAKDMYRPFRVHTLGGVITAIGTSFDVRATGDRVAVAVIEGAVKVEQGAVAPVRLGLGEQLTFAPRKKAVLKQVDPAQPARWREGWLVYRDEPLRDVIADVSRYTSREIQVQDSVSAQLRYTGSVSRDSVVEWVEALPEVFPVEVETGSQGIAVAGR